MRDGDGPALCRQRVHALVMFNYLTFMGRQTFFLTLTLVFMTFPNNICHFGLFLGREHKREPWGRLNLTSPFEVAPRYPFYSMIS